MLFFLIADLAKYFWFSPADMQDLGMQHEEPIIPKLALLEDPHPAVRQCVIVKRGRFAAQEFLALDLDIMVKVGHQHKE